MVTLRRAIAVVGLVAAVVMGGYSGRFHVRGVSIDGGDSGGRLARPLWNAPRPGDTVNFVRHTGLADRVVVESATPDLNHSLAIFLWIAVAAGLLAFFAGRRAPAEKNL